MVLIADSGATKTDWVVLDTGTGHRQIATQGIHPLFQTEDDMARIVATELLPALGAGPVDELHFYGAGCLPHTLPTVERALRRHLTVTGTVEVCSDLLAAARALCGRQPGIACILGTGSNSCFYDGKIIVKNVKAGGYILGDEGSGAYLGKMLVRALFKGKMPAHLLQAFQKEYQLDLPTVIERTYRTPMANRFLASLTPFLHLYRTEKEIHELLCNAFDDFIFFNLESYRTKSNKVSFIGSIAFYFQEELDSCLKNRGFQMERVIRDPMDGLLEYYLIK